jgi:ech hydrogenase subunit A
MENHEKHKGAQGAKSRQPSFFAVIFLFLTAMNIISISDNLMHLYAFWEVTTLCSFLLIGYDRTRTSYKSAKLALWLNSVGGLFFAGGILLLLQSTGSLSISYIVGHGRMMLPLLAAGVMMLCCAGFVKSAQLPFHSWLLGAMVAPTPVSALLHSSTMVKAGVYVIVRFSPVFAGTLAGDFVAIVGSFTFMAASAIAISQSNGKRVLAYSTIANLGLIIACASLGGAAGLSAAILLMIFHAVSKGLLFLCMGTVEQGIGSRNIEDMFGIYSKMPYTTSIMVLGMISMILPPFGILITKWLALEAAVRVPPVLVLIVLGSAFTIAFWVKWLGATLTVYKPRRRGIEKLPGSMIFALGAIGLMIPVLTAMIAPINNVLVAPAVSTLLRRISPVVGGKDGGIYVRGAGGITGGFGGVLLLLGVMAVAAIVLYLVSRRFHPRIVAPYSCGEHVAGDSKGRDFVGPGDRTERIRIHNYYLSGIFSEAKLLPVSNFISVLLILIMFGVS